MICYTEPLFKQPLMHQASFCIFDRAASLKAVRLRLTWKDENLAKKDQFCESSDACGVFSPSSCLLAPSIQWHRIPQAA